MTPKFCSSCGAALTAGTKFCEQCGFAVERMMAPGTPAPTPPVSEPAPAYVPPPTYASPAPVPGPAPFPDQPEDTRSHWASATEAAPAAVATGAEYAGFGARFVAMFIDGLILWAIWWLLGTFFLQALENLALELGIAFETLVNLVLTVIYWLYFAGMECSAKQGTIGKKIMKLKVTDLQGNRIGFGKATGRYFAKIISALPLCLGYLWVAFSKNKQAWHDKLSGCLVIKRT